jgi:long-chain acyl-CoA synthetase
MRTAADILAGLPPRLTHLLWEWERCSPAAPAVIEGDACWNYAELGEAVRRTKALLASLGVRPGDRVMVVNENCLALCALVLAAADMDVWAAIVNARLSHREIDAIRDHCGARRVFYTVAVSSDAAAHAERHGAETRTLPMLGRLAIGPLDEECRPEPVAEPGAEQVAVLIYTSGTTGEPKGVMLSHRSIMFVGAVSGGLREVRQGDVVYAVLPFSHVFGFASVFVGTLYAGACMMVVPRFTPERVLADLQRGVTVLQGVPAMHAKLLEHIKLNHAAIDTPALRFISAGGSPLDPAVKREIEEAFRLPLHNGYGLTESAPTIAQTRLGDPRGDCSVGPALPGVEIRIVGLDGKDVPAGEVGELWSRGPGVMLGYYRNPTLTKQVIDSAGWLNTGDFARLEADGNLFIVGRSKELIIRSGFNVYPTEVEAVFNAHPMVTQTAVVGRQVEDGNEEVVAFVQVAPGTLVTPDELSAFAARNLASYKRPSEVVVMEHLPAGATGKILKHRLAEMAKRQANGQP